MTSGSSGAGPQDIPGGDDVGADVAERLQYEALLSDLAAGFINLEPEPVDQAIEDCLRRIVEALGVDRSTLFQLSGGDLVATHSWAVPGRERVPTVWARTDLPWAVEQIMTGKSIVFSRLDDLPVEAAIDKELIKRRGPKSNASVPLIARGKIIGALAPRSMRTATPPAPP